MSHSSQSLLINCPKAAVEEVVVALAIQSRQFLSQGWFHIGHADGHKDR